MRHAIVGSALFLMVLIFPGQAAASFTVAELSQHPREKASPAAVGIVKSLMERYGCDERDRVK